MPMKVEAAIVTQKRPEAAYNTDSVNVNGKVMPREVIKNGYKGSGIISGSVYFALTSSSVEGFADATVTAFNERAELFSRARDPISVFSGFFEDCRGALLNMNRSPEELVSAGFYASGRKAVIAHNGDTKIYLQRLGVCTPVTSARVEDTIADFNSSTFNDVCVGDIFILLSPGAAEVLSVKEIEDILKISDGSVKRIVNYILKVALANEGSKAVSAIVVKVLETALDEEIKVPAFVPDFSGIKEAEEVTENVAVAEEKQASQTQAAEIEEPADVPAAVSSEEAQTSDIAEEQPMQTENEIEKDDIAAVFSKNALEMFDEKNEAETTSEVEDSMASASVGIEMTEAISVPDGDNADSKEADEEIETNDNGKNNKSRTSLFVILGIVLVFAIGIIFAAAVIPAFSGDDSEETTTEETTLEETASEEESTIEEETTEKETTEKETTEKATQAETTTRRQTVTEATTAAAIVLPETTEAVATESSTEAETQESTTASAEETSAEEEATSAEEISSQEETTSEETSATEAAASEESSLSEEVTVSEETQAQTEADSENSEAQAQV